MLGLEGERWRTWDWGLFALSAALGGVLAWLVVLRIGSVFFYQMFTPEALMWACGHGFRRPLTLSPAMSDFLLYRRVPNFECASIAVNTVSGPPGLFARSQIYLSWIVAWLWRLLGPTQVAVAPLAAVLGAAYASAAFLLARLFLRRVLAALAALALALSPVAIGMVFALRDFSKAPFFLWAIAMLVLAARANNARRCLYVAVAAGATAGVGYGFRADIGVLLPTGFVFLVIASRLCWSGRTAAGAGYVVSFLVLASPMLALGNGGNLGSLVLEGASEPFRAFLALRPAPYALGSKYSDELALSAIAASERLRHPDWDQREPSPIYGFSQAYTYSFSYVLGWAPNFAADFAAQALKGAAWILGYPALVAITRGDAGTGFPLRLDLGLVRWQEPAYALLGHPWAPLLGLLGVLAWLLRIAARSGREAWGVAALLMVLMTYPGIQFSVRHIFHLEFIWVLAALSLPAAVFECRRIRPVLARFALSASVVFCTVVVAYVALAAVQQRRLTVAFSALLASPRERVVIEREAQQNGAVLLRVPVPDSQAAVVVGPPDAMTDHISEAGIPNDIRAGAERMVLTLEGTSCPKTPIELRLRYDYRPHVWQPLDSSMLAQPGELVIFPAFYRPTQNFAGILLPSNGSGCSVQLARVPLTRDLPALLTAVLPPNWQSLPLREEFGRFDVSPAR